MRRCPGGLNRDKLPVYGWRQRQYQTGDTALAAVFENPYPDYLEVRLPAGVDPNETGLTATYFSGRVEAVWRRSVPGIYRPGVNQPGLAMLSRFRTMEAGETAEATAATARQPRQFGFLVPLGESTPALLMRMPADVDPNAEDPSKFTVVDDCLYVQCALGQSPAWHTVKVACGSGSYVPAPSLLDSSRVVLSDGIAESGKALFEQVVRQGHEGVMPKHLASRYRPGRRSSSWLKIKPTQMLPCVIIGYIPSQSGFRSLLVATQREGVLRYVGELSVGLTRQDWADLARRLPARIHQQPIVPCRKQAVWLEPELYCRVRTLGWTRSGRLRGASFAGLVAR